MTGVPQMMMLLASCTKETQLVQQLEEALSAYKSELAAGNVKESTKATLAMHCQLVIIKTMSEDPMKDMDRFGKMQNWMKLMPKEQES